MGAIHRTQSQALWWVALRFTHPAWGQVAGKIPFGAEQVAIKLVQLGLAVVHGAVGVDHDASHRESMHLS